MNAVVLIAIGSSLLDIDTNTNWRGQRKASIRKLDWDYTKLADAYVHRPDYADSAVDAIMTMATLTGDDPVLDLGAGAGHLTIKLAERGLDVLALEPNDRMRAHGVRRTTRFDNVRWIVGVMERTGLESGKFALCSYGSSFGVTDRAATLAEAARLLRPGGWFACVFNHRDLDDPLQRAIEAHIKTELPEYGYGSRREDQAAPIAASGLFGEARPVSAPIVHEVAATDWVDAWYSHATLQRQAGDRFETIVAGIAEIVAAHCDRTVRVPYVTRGWAAPLLAGAAAT